MNKMEFISDDALRLIFEHLSLYEKLLVERVCSRWQQVVGSCFANMHTINVAAHVNRKVDGDSVRQEQYIESVIVGLMCRAGRFVSEINFGSRWLTVTEPIALAIVQTASERLTRVHLGCTRIQPEQLLTLLPLAPQLLSFSLEETIFNTTAWQNPSPPINDEIATLFRAMVKLEHINLRKTTIDMSSLQALPQTLLSCNIHGCNISLTHLHAFLECHPLLQWLHLGGRSLPIDQMTITCLSKLAHLTKLELSYKSTAIGAAATIDLNPLQKLTKLEYLDLRYCHHINDHSLHTICEKLPKLNELFVNYCRNISQYLPLGHCSQLTELQLGGSPYELDAALQALASNRCLERLYIEMCVRMTDIGVQAIINHCPLTTLCITHCPSVSDSLITSIVTAANQQPAHAQQINRLRLIGCQISDSGVIEFTKLRNINQFKHIDLSYNDLITDHSILCLWQSINQQTAQDNDVAADQSIPSRAPQPITIHVQLTNVTRLIDQKVAKRIALVH